MEELADLIVGPIVVDLKLVLDSSTSTEGVEDSERNPAIATKYSNVLDKTQTSDEDITIRKTLSLTPGFDYIFLLSDSYDPPTPELDNNKKISYRNYNYTDETTSTSPGVTFDIGIYPDYIQILQTNQEKDELNRIKGTKGEVGSDTMTSVIMNTSSTGEQNYIYNDIYGVKTGAYKTITDSNGGIWNSYIDRKDFINNFSTSDYIYNSNYNLYSATQDEINNKIVDIIPRVWTIENSEIHLSEVNIDKDVNY